MPSSFIRIIAVLATLFPMALPAAAARGPFVERFTPVGTAKNVRQVTVRFTSPMVALGDPRLPDPFDVRCSAQGQGRWADSRNWIYDFGADLPAGERCSFTLKAAARTLEGAAPLPAERAQRFDFTTGGPAIIGSHPSEESDAVDEEQVFLLKLDAAADLASVRARASCVVEGIGERIPLEVLEGDARAAVLRERASLGYWYYRLLWKTGAESRLRVRDQSIDEAEAKIVLARCQRPLPPGASLQIAWGAGIATTTGIATEAQQTLAFRVRNAFTAQTQCTRTNAKAGCLPMLPISVQFSAPVPRELAAAVRLKLPNGKQVAPRLEPQLPTVDSIAFDPPFVENHPVQVLLPARFVDDAGRTLGNAQRFPLEVRVDGFPPLAKFSGTFGILESKRRRRAAGDGAQPRAAAACPAGGDADASDAPGRRPGAGRKLDPPRRDGVGVARRVRSGR